MTSCHSEKLENPIEIPDEELKSNHSNFEDHNSDDCTNLDHFKMSMEKKDKTKP